MFGTSKRPRSAPARGTFRGIFKVRADLAIETNPVDVGIRLTQVSSTASNVAGLQQHTLVSRR